jgi:hypothetical protein
MRHSVFAGANAHSHMSLSAWTDRLCSLGMGRVHGTPLYMDDHTETWPFHKLADKACPHLRIDLDDGNLSYRSESRI